MKRIHKLLGIGLVVVSAALTGCGSSNDSSEQFTGAQLVQGMMGYGPAAKSFGDTGTLQDRLDHTKMAIKNHAIPPELLQNYIVDLKPASGDPLPPPSLPSLPTEQQLEQLAQAVDMVKLPSEQQFEKFVGYLIDEINRQAPGLSMGLPCRRRFRTVASRCRKSRDAFCGRTNARPKGMAR